MTNSGIVYLVGAGPGDPKLLTLGGREALEKADVVVYDRLTHPKLLTFARNDAELIYAGKSADRHVLTQDEINACIYEHASEGKVVTRLKGGDPFIFGRGGEEAEYLRERGIGYVVIPGISSSIAAPAYAGIPVTHRDDSSSFAVITGHERADTRESGTRIGGEAEQRRRWDRIAWAADTLVFLMGVDSIGEIASNLMENGRLESTPVAMVRWGTWAGRQKVLVSTLGTVAKDVAEAKFAAPAVTVVGDVVHWRDRLAWWDNRPLSGKRIVVTRAREQASSLVDLLETQGAEAIEFPTIKIEAPSYGFTDLDNALVEIGEFDWVVFASVNAVDSFFARLRATDQDLRSLAGVKFAVVGNATALRLFAAGINPDYVPIDFTSEEMAKTLPGELQGAKILLLTPEGEQSGAIKILLERGADVGEVAAYRNVPDSGQSDSVRARFDEQTIDCVTFTSSSTVKNFAAALGPVPPAMIGVTLACIGPSTAQTMREIFQREPDIIAGEHTIQGLVDALVRYYREG